MKKTLINLAKQSLHSVGLDLIRYQASSENVHFPSDFEQSDIEIIQRVQPFTYTSPERIQAFCAAVRYVSAHRIPGDIVECGVWKGGSVMAAMLTLKKLEEGDRDFYLYDTFEGMSEPTNRDISIEGKAASMIYEQKQIEGEKWVYSSLEEVQEAVYGTGYNPAKIHCIPGKVEDTLPHTLPEKIAILRLDTDWYESTLHELVHLFPRLVQGGVLIIDDYGHWKGAREAVDQYIRENQIRIFLNRIDYTGRLGIKL